MAQIRTSLPSIRLVCVFAISAVLIVQAASLQSANLAQQAAPIGRLVGQVVDATTARPIAGAWVTVKASVGVTTAPVFVTGTDGRFAFDTLPAGRYSVAAQRPGYAPGTHGARRVNGPAQLLDVSDSPTSTTALVRLWKYGSISGRVLDEAGEPVVNVMLNALRQGVVAGQRAWTLGDLAPTDDRGVYRFDSLLGGNYLVVVPASMSSTPTAVTDAVLDALATRDEKPDAVPQALAILALGSQRTASIRAGDLDLTVYPLGGALLQPPHTSPPYFAYASTFNPGVSRTADASVIVLTAGEDRDGVDVRVAPVPTTRISGIATDETGRVVPFAGVELLQNDLPLPGSGSWSVRAVTTVTDRAGRFTIAGVPAGGYRLRASELNTSYAEVSLTAGSADIENVSLTLRRTSVEGRVVFKGQAPAPASTSLRNLLVSLVPVGSRQLLPGARPDADGHFEIAAHPPGRYWIAASQSIPGWGLSGVTVDGVDAFTTPIDITTRSIGNVTVEFTDTLTILTGTVRGSEPDIEAALIVAFPSDHASHVETGVNPRLIVTAIASKTGTFELRVPRGGGYHIVALPADASTEFDTKTLATLATLASVVLMKDGERRQITVAFTSTR